MLLLDDARLVFSLSPFSTKHPGHAGEFILSRTCAIIPFIISRAYASILWIEVSDASDPFSSSPFYTLVSCHAGEFPRRDLGLHYLLLFPEPSCRPDDHDMSDGSDPSCTCDSHVVGPDAKLNNDPMDVDVGVLSACKIIRRVPRPSIRAVNALAIVLSHLS